MTTKPRRPIHPTAIAPDSAPPSPVVAESATTETEAMINRAYNRPLTQEEGAFLASLRTRIDAGQELSEFDRGWLVDLAGR